MMLAEFYIHSNASLQAAVGNVTRLLVTHKKLHVRVDADAPRSLEQNALSHTWYEQIAKALPEDNKIGWKSYCKLHHGVPILRMDDEEFREFYDRAIKVLTYEQKLEAMKFIPVTSLMNTRQLSTYLEMVQEDFFKRGVLLEFPAES